MRVSVSSLAWSPADDGAVAALLDRHGVDAVDVVPTKYWPDLGDADDASVVEVRRWWAARGVGIVGMQSLLFGTAGLNVFGAPAVRREMLAHLERVCRVAAGLGATRLVFGSPRNRDPGDLPADEARSIAVDFFGELGDVAARHGATIALEPNPARYGSRFMLDSRETAAVVRAVDHDAIGLQLDLGACRINGESDAVLDAVGDLVRHVHVSDPDLVPVRALDAPHPGFARRLNARWPGLVAAVEMLPPDGPRPLEALERAVADAVATYRGAPPA